MSTAPCLAEVRQCAESVLLVRPAGFGYNSQTADSNRFQQRSSTPGVAIAAQQEFDAVCAALEAAGVGLCMVEDSAEPLKPDALFPNNWLSLHRDGTVVLYPMQAANRRAERRPEIVQLLSQQSGFRQRRLIDLSAHEQRGRFLEGTGSLVLDHLQRIAYACRSVRTDESLVRQWAQLMHYEPVLFDACGRDGTPIYHTNVLLAIGTRWAVVAGAAIAPADRQRVLERLAASDREIIEIGLPALEDFAANVLELAGGSHSGEAVLIMSERARSALCAQRSDWERLCGAVDRVLSVAVPTIESVGGGGVRCMLAEAPTVSLP